MPGAQPHIVTPATLDGRVLDAAQMSVLGCELLLGCAGGPPRCHACGVEATWNGAVHLQVGGHTVGYAILYHCLQHRPVGGPLALPGGGTVMLVVPPPSSNWATMNGLPAPGGSPLPPLAPPPRLG